MLQTCINHNLFLYAMIIAGAAGIWCLFWSNRFYTRAIRDLRRLDRPKGRWTADVLETYQKRERPLVNTGAFIRNQLSCGRSVGIPVGTLCRGSQFAALFAAGVLAASLWIMYRYEYERYLEIQYAALGGAIIVGLLLIRTCLDYGGKEEILLDGWTDYLENSAPVRATAVETSEQGETGSAEETRALQRAREDSLDPGEEERISQVREGIRQTAAADSRFSGLLTPEEEKIMREVIREYMT